MPEEAGSLYDILGVEPSASAAEVKKAYYQLALKLHPDKNPDDEEAKSKFQVLQKVYAILGDVEKRKVYDETGVTDDDLLSSKFEDLVDYFRALYGGVTEQGIDDFMDNYRGSDEETQDLFQYYTQYEGNMTKVFEWLMCSDSQLDSHRFMDAIEQGISKGKLKRCKAFTSWAKSVASTPRPDNPLKPRGGSKAKAGGSKGSAIRGDKAGGPSSSNALVAAIQGNRAAAADNFFDSLAAKYGGGSSKAPKAAGRKKGKQAAVEDGPSEEAFAAVQARLDKQRAAASASNAAAATSKSKSKRAAAEPASDDLDDENDNDEDGDDVDDVDSEEEEEEKPNKGKKSNGAGKMGKASGSKALKSTTTSTSQGTAGAKMTTGKQGAVKEKDGVRRTEKENLPAASGKASKKARSG